MNFDCTNIFWDRKFIQVLNIVKVGKLYRRYPRLENHVFQLSIKFYQETETIARTLPIKRQGNCTPNLMKVRLRNLAKPYVSRKF